MRCPKSILCLAVNSAELCCHVTCCCFPSGGMTEEEEEDVSQRPTSSCALTGGIKVLIFTGASSVPSPTWRFILLPGRCDRERRSTCNTYCYRPQFSSTGRHWKMPSAMPAVQSVVVTRQKTRTVCSNSTKNKNSLF